ncbi:MAG: cobalt-precorrin-5B (C(1))-methyltransferase [Pikeienuella sp.]
MTRKPETPLRTGFTTGACATAAVKAAYARLLTGETASAVTITLPRGQNPSFSIFGQHRGDDWASATIRKDAGDDPDVTHRALISARVRILHDGSGIHFKAGDGVGMVTKPGLPIPPGEPAINPVPRDMMKGVIHELARATGAPGDVEITISVEGGAELAKKTWNPRLGIEGGLSILGTTGIVRPFSCAAWIASIHRGIDVARATGAVHVAGATGATSEKTAQAALNLTDQAMLDMGDFAGGMLKYLARNPVERVTIAGGFGKLTKLAQGALDLHSGRSQVDFARLSVCDAVAPADREAVANSNTAKEALEIVGPALAVEIAHGARETAQKVLRDAPVSVDVMVIDRVGAIIAHVGAAK